MNQKPVHHSRALGFNMISPADYSTGRSMSRPVELEWMVLLGRKDNRAFVFIQLLLGFRQILRIELEARSHFRERLY